MNIWNNINSWLNQDKNKQGCYTCKYFDKNIAVIYGINDMDNNCTVNYYRENDDKCNNYKPNIELFKYINYIFNK